MSRKNVPAWSFPRFPFSSMDENEEEWMQDFTYPSGLSVFEDEQNVYIEAALPGIKPDEIEMTYDKGMLWIKAEKKEESRDKSKKYYRKATSTFSYHVAVPGNVDENKPPEAVCKNGVITVTFMKTKKAEPRKIPIKSG